MTNVNKTLYIPLYGKAYVSRRGIILRDEKAESIWAEVAFPLRGKAKSKWLACYMGMRAAVFDRWAAAQTGDIVLHIGCGLDSRAERVGAERPWYDMDFPEVIAERKLYYTESGHYRMVAGDARDEGFLDPIPRGGRAIIVMEGVSMYLQREELKNLLLENQESWHVKHYVIPIDTVSIRYNKYHSAIMLITLHPSHSSTKSTQKEYLVSGLEIKCPRQSQLRGAFCRKLRRRISFTRKLWI